MALLAGTGTDGFETDLVEERQKNCTHVVFHKSIEEVCPEMMYCIYCGKTWTVEEWDELHPEGE